MGVDQEIKVTSELQKSMDQEHMAVINLTFEPLKIKQSRASEEQSSNQAHFLSIKNLDPSHKCFNRQHISDYSLCQVHDPDC